jgi:hypothetical protein
LVGSAGGAAPPAISHTPHATSTTAAISHPVPETLPLASAADVTVHRGPTAGELSCPDPNGMAVYVMPER